MLFRKRSHFCRIILGRHGYTYKNEEEEKALAREEKKFKIGVPDRKVKLTPRGVCECFSQGMFLASLPVEERPTLFVSTGLRRTKDGLRLVLLGANISSRDVTVDHHPLLQDRLLGLRYPYTDAKYFFKDYPKEVELKEQAGKFDYSYPGGESQKQLSVRVRQALDELETAYSKGHETIYIECHNSTIRIMLSIFLGLSEEAFYELPGIPNGSMIFLVRENASRLMKEERPLFVPPLVTRKDYRSLCKERKPKLKGIAD
jgi:broad specificity phosphatase PhoE